MYKQFESTCMQFCKKELCASIFSEIMAQYQTPQRYYHTFYGHIASCMTELMNIPSIEHDSRHTLAMAVLLHDVIMDFCRNDNEEQSATFAIALCRRIGASQDFKQKVIHYILSTKHNMIPKDHDAKLMIDIDLTIFGQDMRIFDAYEKCIRKEYLFVPEMLFRKKRIEIIAQFLNRPTIFLTPHFQKKYELQAQTNLLRSIEQLER